MRRLKELLKAFFTGIVSDIPEPILQAMASNWSKLQDKADFMATVKARSDARRQSMYETATRSNYLLVVAAFAIGANATMLVASNTSTAGQVLLTISVGMIAISAAILIVAISAKSKVMKKPRKGGEIEPAEMLQLAVEVEAQAANSPKGAVSRERALASGVDPYQWPVLRRSFDSQDGLRPMP